MATVQKQHIIVVFNDGETWSTIDGCKVMYLNDDQMSELMQGRDPGKLSSKPWLVTTLTTKLWHAVVKKLGALSA